MIDDGIDKPGHSTRLLVQQALRLYTPDTLLPFLVDKDTVVRTAAAMQLHIRGGKLAFDEARRLCASKKVPDREIAAFLLGQLGAPQRPFRRKSLPLLLGLLQDEHERVRESAAAALGHLRCRAAVPLLIDASVDPSSGVRSAIAFALTQFRSDQLAKKCLADLSEDPSEEVRFWSE